MKEKIEQLTLSRFKDGFSLIPMYNIAKIADKYSLKSGKLMFRSFTDLVAEHVWQDAYTRTNVLNQWDHCFPKKYELVIVKIMEYVKDIISNPSYKMVRNQQEVFAIYKALGHDSVQNRALFVNKDDSFDVYEFTGYEPVESRELRKVYSKL